MAFADKVQEKNGQMKHITPNIFWNSKNSFPFLWWEKIR